MKIRFFLPSITSWLVYDCVRGCEMTSDWCCCGRRVGWMLFGSNCGRGSRYSGRARSYKFVMKQDQIRIYDQRGQQISSIYLPLVLVEFRIAESTHSVELLLAQCVLRRALMMIRNVSVHMSPMHDLYRISRHFHRSDTECLCVEPIAVDAAVAADDVAVAVAVAAGYVAHNMMVFHRIRDLR